MDGRKRRVELTSKRQEKLTESHQLRQSAQDCIKTAYGSDRAAALPLALAEILPHKLIERTIRPHNTSHPPLWREHLTY